MVDTEIDWKAYMEQVEQILAGERDYAVIKGGTGPLWYRLLSEYRTNDSYPAGHVWIYTALYKITSNGRDIFSAQVVFMFLYLTTLAVTLSLYRTAKVPSTKSLYLLTIGAPLRITIAVPLETITQYLYLTIIQRLLDSIIPPCSMLAFRQTTMDGRRNCLCACSGNQNECIALLPWDYHCHHACHGSGASDPDCGPHSRSSGIPSFSFQTQRLD
jgi:hypothetical protein